MRVTSLYPVLMTDDVAAGARFFVELLDFETVFETDWYASLVRDGQEVALLDRDHATIPEGFRGESATHVLVNVEVDDVDAVHARLVTEGPCEAVLPLRSEDFGQRHFIVRGPAGVLVDVITPIPTTGEYAGLASEAGA